MKLLLAIILSLLCTAASCSPNVTYCVSSDNGSCDPHPNCNQCHPLMWFVNGSQSVPNNTAIIFLPGNHTLDSIRHSSATVTFLNKNNLQLRSCMNESLSKVICVGNETGFYFGYSSNIRIDALIFEDCGFSVAKNKAALYFNYSKNIFLSHVAVLDSIRYSLSINAVCGGNVEITSSKFVRCLQGFSNACSYAGIVFVSLDQCPSPSSSMSFIIAESTISSSQALSGRGLIIWINRPSVNVIIRDVTIANGSGVFGGNVKIKMKIFRDNPNTVQFMNVLIINGSAQHGGGIHIILEHSDSNNYRNQLTLTQQRANEITFVNTTFQGNNATYKNGSGGGFSNSHSGSVGLDNTLTEINFINCTFSNNSAQTGAAILINQYEIPRFKLHYSLQLSVTMDNCIVAKNHLNQYSEQINGDGIIDMYSLDKMTIKNSVFADNYGSALLMVGTDVLFEGKTVFHSNSAPYGAALRVCERSMIFLQNGTHIQFENNFATIAGGAMYVGGRCLEKAPPCFYQILSNLTSAELTNNREISLDFNNNKACVAGDAIYGGSVDHCFFLKMLHTGHWNDNHGEFYKAIFNFTHKTPSMVTSDPYGVCICALDNGFPYCLKNELIIEPKHPGEKFIVNVTAVGQTNGTIPSPLNVSSSSPDTMVTMYDYHPPETITCQSITVAVFSKPNTSPTLRFSIVKLNPTKEQSNYYNRPLLKATIQMNDCPWIFQLNSTNSCDCHSIIKRVNKRISCDITKMTVWKDNTWLDCSSFTTDFKKCSKIEISTRCKYCRNGTFTPLKLNTSQCIEGRQGRLCGRCSSNYTLSLGTPKCIKTADHCSSWQLMILLTAFFLAGIFLICFLTVFNFTVAEGTINGLLFYASCFDSNQQSFFNFHHNTSLGPNFFEVFISWLNLDLGFQVCFYSGMTVYQKIWLEFGFLLYLLLLGVMIVCLSRRFVWFTRLAGRNVVPVLATIVLFAYPKLVRNSIIVWRCHNLYSTDNSTTLSVWSQDPTINCFEGKHLVLMITSILIFIATFLFTLCLLLFQCLQRGSSWCVLRWVNKLRPFFDANTGPCRDHYRFWPGLILFVRFGVLVVSSFGHSDKFGLITITAVCVFLFFLFLVFPGSVYKKWPLNVLEFWFFFCLGLTSALLYLNKQYTKEITNTSIGIIAATFLLILVYSCYKKLCNTRKWKKIVARIQERLRSQKNTIDLFETNEREPLITPEIMPQVITYDALREPLLED